MHADGSDVHAEDGCTASHVEDDFVLEDVLVVVDGVAVGAGADLIFLFHCCQSLSPTSCLLIAVNQPTFPRGCLKLHGVSVYIQEVSFAPQN